MFQNYLTFDILAALSSPESLNCIDVSFFSFAVLYFSQRSNSFDLSIYCPLVNCEALDNVVVHCNHTMHTYRVSLLQFDLMPSCELLCELAQFEV